MIYFPIICFDGCYDSKYECHQSYDRQQNKADKHYHQYGGRYAVYRIGNNKIQVFLSVKIYKRRFLFFQKPDKQRPDQGCKKARYINSHCEHSVIAGYCIHVISLLFEYLISSTEKEKKSFNNE